MPYKNYHVFLTYSFTTFTTKQSDIIHGKIQNKRTILSFQSDLKNLSSGDPVLLLTDRATYILYMVHKS